MKMILGKKIGMTQIFSETGEVIPVTVIEAGPEVVTQVKTEETDGYDAVQIGFEDAKPQRVNKPLTGHFAKAGVSVKKHLAEFKPDEGDSYEVGQVINDGQRITAGSVGGGGRQHTDTQAQKKCAAYTPHHRSFHSVNPSNKINSSSEMNAALMSAQA